MTPEHTERAIREGCPALKNAGTCAYAALGCCPAVDIWRLSHKSWTLSYYSAPPREFYDYQTKVRVNT